VRKKVEERDLKKEDGQEDDGEVEEDKEGVEEKKE
jgi:hypothetical protein